MDTSKAKKSNKKGDKGERKNIEVSSYEVQNVRVVDGKNGDIVFFTLVLNGVTIYNCRVASGKNGDFISFPQYKGNNGTYYNNVYVSLSDEDSNKILADIQKIINEQ
jgi:DNA-binding cell septation regulator SpoVG